MILLVPAVLDLAIARAVENEARRTGLRPVNVLSAIELLELATSEMHQDCQARYVGLRVDYFNKSKSPRQL